MTQGRRGGLKEALLLTQPAYGECMPQVHGGPGVCRTGLCIIATALKRSKVHSERHTASRSVARQARE
eukprot:6462984-Alexandrium_andersonii.AAC.1